MYVLAWYSATTDFLFNIRSICNHSLLIQITITNYWILHVLTSETSDLLS